MSHLSTLARQRKLVKEHALRGVYLDWNGTRSRVVDARLKLHGKYIEFRHLSTGQWVGAPRTDYDLHIA